MPETIPSGVPVISPEGQAGFLPQENLQAALGRGFKMASFVTSPEGQSGLLPLDKVHEAIQNRGFKLGPASQQNTSIDNPDKPQNAMEYIGAGIKQGAYAIPNMYEGAIKGAQDIVAGKNQHNLTSGMAGVGRLAQQFNPLPPDQGQGIVNRVAQGAGAVAGAAMTGLPEAEGAVRATTEAAKDLKPNVPAIKEAVFPGPQAKVMPSANMPLLAKSGVEDVFRAAAPTAMNKGFRENLNVAAPDLADIARKVDVSEAKGGIVNPDMRVRATVQAINDHLGEMYQQERAPQIQRNADAQVKVGTNPNSQRGLEFLESVAGDVADSKLATKALKGGVLSVAETDRLAQLANQTLRSYEKMTPEGKMTLQTTSPKIGGIKALDSELSDNLNDVLQANGEKGITSYERRYAALSAVRDQLESRMNATELKQEGAIGAIGRITRPMVKLATQGKSGIPSASQAAVADVNIGRSLQMGLSKLKASGLTAQEGK